MHGIVHVELKKFVETVYDEDTWEELTEKAGLANKLYLASQTYSDSEIMALVSTAVEMTGKSAEELLGLFGEFMLPNLMKLYGPLVRPEWKTLDFMLGIEETIHTVVRSRNVGAQPPKLRVERTSPNEIVLHYSSSRKLCPFAKGMVRGVANHYNENIQIHDKSCMLHGDATCEITITLQ